MVHDTIWKADKWQLLNEIFRKIKQQHKNQL